MTIASPLSESSQFLYDCAFNDSRVAGLLPPSIEMAKRRLVSIQGRFLLTLQEAVIVSGGAQIGHATAPGGVFTIKHIPRSEQPAAFQGDDALIDELLLNDETAKGSFEVVLWHRYTARAPRPLYASSTSAISPLITISP